MHLKHDFLITTYILKKASFDTNNYSSKLFDTANHCKSRYEINFYDKSRHKQQN